MNNENTFWVSIILLTVAIMSIFTFSSSFANATLSGNVIDSQNQYTNSGDVQIVKLKVQGSSYVLEPSTVKKGIPVRLEADMSAMPGCSRSIVISAFNVRKSFTSTDNKVEFTPDKSGTFNIACSMNMYKGKFTVLDFDGTKAAYVEPAKVGGGCGMSASGGGCGGCGG